MTLDEKAKLHPERLASLTFAPHPARAESQSSLLPKAHLHLFIYLHLFQLGGYTVQL